MRIDTYTGEIVFSTGTRALVFRYPLGLDWTGVPPDAFYSYHEGRTVHVHLSETEREELAEHMAKVWLAWGSVQPASHQADQLSLL